MSPVNRLIATVKNISAPLFLLLALTAALALILPHQMSQPATDGVPVPDDAVARLGHGKIDSADMTGTGTYLAVGTTLGLDLYQDAGPSFHRLWSANENEAEAVRFSPDGQLLASREFDRVLIRNLRGDVLTTLKGGIQGSYDTLEWSPDGRMLLVGSWLGPPDTAVPSIWDAATGTKLLGIGYPYHYPWVTGAWSPDGRSVWLATMDAIFEYSIPGGEKIQEIEANGWNAFSLAVSPDGTRIAVGYAWDRYVNDPSKVMLWDARTGDPLKVIQGPDDGVIDHLIWSSDDATITAAFRGGQVMRRDASTGEAIDDFEAGQDVVMLKLDARNDPVMMLDDGSLIARRPEGMIRSPLPGYTDMLTSVAWSPGGARIATGGLNGVISLWNVRSRSLLCTMPGADGWQAAVAWSPDGRQLAASGYGAIQVWDPDTCALRAQFVEGGGPITWSPDGRTIAARSIAGDALVALWEPQTGRAAKFGLPGLDPSEHQAAALAWSPDGARIYVAISHTLAEYSSPTLFVWDTSGGASQAIRPGDTQSVFNIALSPDEAMIAVTGYCCNADLYAFTLPRGLILYIQHLGGGSTGAAFSPDGKRIAFADGSRVVVGEASTRHRIRTFKGYGVVKSISWAPDSRSIASASDDGTVTIWKVK